jgi:hypothetical protein
VPMTSRLLLQILVICWLNNCVLSSSVIGNIVLLSGATANGTLLPNMAKLRVRANETFVNSETNVKISQISYAY